MYPIKLIFADTPNLFSESLTALLQAEKSIQVCAVVHSGEELFNQVEQHLPGVVLLGLQLTGSRAAEITRSLKERYPWVAVLGISPFDNDDLICELAEAGVDGYVSKGTSSGKDLLRALHTVYGGEHYFHSRIFLRLSRRVTAQKQRPGPAPTFNPKEIGIMRLVCEQYSSKQIAPLVGLTERSVEIYREKIMEKTGARNGVGIAMYAVKNDIFQLTQ